ncbi:MAG: dTDP-4-dehydrorhamnose 3,5-epimerase [Deltaproteobacteria bacterium]|nr:dTDP-4-dehydrorhamnose 3,5-epimerase [Deltaproteobacteria bacterium]MBW2536771.1 dTDP-4-dehydrorhamnose 3,5-epimerase [Deltaproteobacteria bacterium]
MKVTPTEIPDVLLIEPEVFRDERGFFLESYQRERFRDAGIDCEFVQDNHAKSVRGTVRGLHFQRKPGQAKLVRATCGRVWDVAVDIRPDSKTFGRWVARELSEDNHHMLFVPVGFAHGYAVLSDVAEFQYKCSWYYLPDEEAGFRWNDPDVGVEWPIDAPILSNRDQTSPCLRELFPERPPERWPG